MNLTYFKAQPILLKDHAFFTEKWLQDRIAEDPSILGLGKVDLLARERIHEKAGRLDLLLIDRENNCRYEVELMLGQTDESHVIRTVEYWDIERRRYPGYDHCAVLVAENVTSRFLNVLSLFAGSIPFVALQLTAVQVGDKIVLNFVRVLDRIGLRTDDESEPTASHADRGYWVGWSSSAVMDAVDRVLETINANAQTAYGLNYVQSYVGLFDGAHSRNFIYFNPKRDLVYIYARIQPREEWISRLEVSGVECGLSGQRRIWVTVRLASLQDDLQHIRPLLAEAVQQYESQ